MCPPFWFSLPPHPLWPTRPRRLVCPTLPLTMRWPDSVVSAELLLAMSGTGSTFHSRHDKSVWIF